MRYAVKRLVRGQDLKRSLSDLMDHSKFEAACLISIVGSLTQARLRAAGAEKIIELTGPLEIVCGTGTLSPGSMHIHVALADANGATFGGHLIDGCIVASTVELVIAHTSGWRFARQVDSSTGYAELIATESGS